MKDADDSSIREPDQPDRVGLEVDGGYYVRDGDAVARVRFKWGERHGHLSPREARDMALYLIHAADLGQADADLYNLLVRPPEPMDAAEVEALITRLQRTRSLDLL